jgi:hypothetical protein
MSCRACGSRREAEFTAEVMIHFTGLHDQDKTGVLVFPRLLVCLDCGSSRFTTPEAELTQLARATSLDEASPREERHDLAPSLGHAAGA